MRTSNITAECFICDLNAQLILIWTAGLAPSREYLAPCWCEGCVLNLESCRRRAANDINNDISTANSMFVFSAFFPSQCNWSNSPTSISICLGNADSVESFGLVSFLIVTHLMFLDCFDGVVLAVQPQHAVLYCMYLNRQERPYCCMCTSSGISSAQSEEMKLAVTARWGVWLNKQTSIRDGRWTQIKATAHS